MNTGNAHSISYIEYTFERQRYNAGNDIFGDIYRKCISLATIMGRYSTHKYQKTSDEYASVSVYTFSYN